MVQIQFQIKKRFRPKEDGPIFEIFILNVSVILDIYPVSSEPPWAMGITDTIWTCPLRGKHNKSKSVILQRKYWYP